AIFDVCAALFDPGDEVLVPAPYWVTYPAAISLTGATPVPVPSLASTGFKVTPDDLDRVRTAATKALILVSPSNPTGSVYSHEELAAIAEWASRHGVWVVSDEIYQRLAYGYPEAAPSIAAAGADLDRLVLVNGVAKSFAMTGWRVGWAIAPPDIVGAAERFQSHATGNVSNVAQRAAIAALTGPQDTVVSMRKAFDRRRRLMYELVTAIPGIECHEPEGAFYVFPDVSAHVGDRFASTDEMSMAILEDAGVATVSGEAFGMPGHIRLSYATGEPEIERGMSAMRDLLISNSACAGAVYTRRQWTSGDRPRRWFSWSRDSSRPRRWTSPPPKRAAGSRSKPPAFPGPTSTSGRVSPRRSFIPWSRVIRSSAALRLRARRSPTPSGRGS